MFVFYEIFPYAGFSGLIGQSSAGKEIWDAFGNRLQFLWIFVGPECVGKAFRAGKE